MRRIVLVNNKDDKFMDEIIEVFTKIAASLCYSCNKCDSETRNVK